MRRHSETTLVRAPDTARQARRVVAAACADWRIRGLSSDAEIVASELVEQSMLHTVSPPRLRLLLRDGSLTVAVTDDVPPGQDEETGELGDLSTRLITQLTRVWGCTWNRAGKTVWAVLPTDE